MMITSFSSLSLNKLNDYGFVLMSPACDISLIAQAFDEVSKVFSSSRVINVNADNIIMKTLNGDELVDLCPSVKIIYKYILENLRRVFPQIMELEDNTIGISSNFLSGNSDRFRLHFDRNQLTVVIYLNDLDSFPLVLYPNIRNDPMITGIKDLFDIKTAKSETIFPRQNLAVVFYGRRTYHGVVNSGKTRENNKSRYSLQFAFDFEEFDYSDQPYYGEKQ